MSDGVRISGPPERIRAELSGRIGEHPACPRLLDHGEDWMLIESLEGPVEAPLQVVLGWPGGVLRERSGSLGELLNEMPGTVDPRKALRKLGLRRAGHRLARPLRLFEERGPSLGGVHGGWLRQASGRVVALRWSRASLDGWPAMDRAATAWMAGEEVPEEWDLPLLRVLLDEAVLGRDEGAAARALACVESLIPRGEPAALQVEMEGPSWLDTQRWTGLRSPSEARRALRMDGLDLGGSPLSVRCTPPIRMGARPERREPRALRLNRLFSRWARGIRIDEEGLVGLTPEDLALEAAQSCSGRVLDATCGAGGLAIALARVGCSVVAADTSAERIAMARHNAQIYEVSIDFRVQDARTVVGDFDHVVVDPPWGGPAFRAGLGLNDLPLARDLVGRAPSVHLKLPVDFDLETLPSGASPKAMVDARGIIKFLWVTCS